MSDQQRASGETSAPQAAASTPEAEAAAARPTGAGKPPTTSEQQGATAGKTAKSEPEAGEGTGTGTDTGSGADEATGSAEAAGAPKAAPAEGGTDGPGDTGKASETGKAEGTATGGKAAEGDGAGDTGGAGSEGGTDNGARALSAAATRGRPEALAAAVDSKGTGTITASGIGRPRKPVLAGAALAGAVLIAVPLLITVTDKDEDKKAIDTAASDTVLNKEDAPAGVFVTQTPSPSKTKEKKKETEKAEPAPPAAAKAAAPSPSASPSPSKTKKKKAATKKAVSTLPAVLTRVLIKNNANGTCVDIPGFSSGRQDGPITQATCNSNTDDNQLWNVEKRYDKAGPGGAPLFQIRNVMDSMCLDLPGYGGAGGATKVTEFPCNGTTNDNQLWWLDKQADGKYWIRNAASNNQCLDSYGRDDATRDLIIWPCSPEGQNNHEWIFTRS
ncbi:RICIN domain-containing protein [Streptomyces apricus]|uniref:Ricin-type beta-trefoil lectin domain protein n=1 Tax=Streptomyces apricus TaxID=1828112 RepID=A0A5A9ZLH1_9ACTN|nr:RICIN domain-containing protein [Streptomyces apricus]KAA0917815.1 ricin-type beta-trefoil lectin domain protein [Streptomyces apricus]